MIEISIKRLLDAHLRTSSRNSLKRCLGDGYLLAHNRVYGNIRNVVSALGFTFSDEPSCFASYDAFSLSQLPTILKERIIPYRDQVTALEKIREVSVTALSIGNPRLLQPNHVFHESCHAIARACSDANLPDTDHDGGRALEQERKYALKILLEESFANSCEAIASVDVSNAIHQGFFKLSSFVDHSKQVQGYTIRAIDQIGFDATLKLIVLSFLHSNFMYEKLPRWQFLKFMDFVHDGRSPRLGTAATRNLLLLARRGLRLAPGFRMFTAAFYFKFVGIRSPLEPLLDFDYLDALEKDRVYRDFLDQVCGCAENGIIPSSAEKAA